LVVVLDIVESYSSPSLFISFKLKLLSCFLHTALWEPFCIRFLVSMGYVMTIHEITSALQCNNLVLD